RPPRQARLLGPRFSTRFGRSVGRFGRGADGVGIHPVLKQSSRMHPDLFGHATWALRNCARDGYPPRPLVLPALPPGWLAPERGKREGARRGRRGSAAPAHLARSLGRARGRGEAPSAKRAKRAKRKRAGGLLASPARLRWVSATGLV